jgi:NAD(P)-dependent dehydrogenase (short-subunit alcohol dehydrogenase family)
MARLTVGTETNDVTPVEVDMVEPAGPDHLAAEAVARHGRIDILVNHVGGPTTKAERLPRGHRRCLGRRPRDRSCPPVPEGRARPCDDGEFADASHAGGKTHYATQVVKLIEAGAEATSH